MSWCYISLFGQQRVHFWRFRRRNEFCRGEPLFGWCRDYKLSSFSFSPHKTVQAFPNTFEYFQVLPSCTPVLFIPCSQDCPVQCPSTSEYFWVLPNTFEYFQVLLSCTPVLFILCSQDCPSTSEYFQILPSCSKYFSIFSSLDCPSTFLLLSAPHHPSFLIPSSSDAFFHIFHSFPSDPFKLRLILSSLDFPCVPPASSTIWKARLHPSELSASIPSEPIAFHQPGIELHCLTITFQTPLSHDSPSPPARPTLSSSVRGYAPSPRALCL